MGPNSSNAMVPETAHGVERKTAWRSMSRQTFASTAVTCVSGPNNNGSVTGAILEMNLLWNDSISGEEIKKEGKHTAMRATCHSRRRQHVLPDASHPLLHVTSTGSGAHVEIESSLIPLPKPPWCDMRASGQIEHAALLTRRYLHSHSIIEDAPDQC
jgi:hypothetical protein